MSYPGKLQDRLTARRQAFYKAISTGMALSEAVPTFAERYKVSQDAIYKDWQKREKWDVITVDPNQVVQDCANELDEVRSRLWTEAKDALTEGARIKALSKLSDIIFR